MSDEAERQVVELQGEVFQKPLAGGLFTLSIVIPSKDSVPDALCSEVNREIAHTLREMASILEHVDSLVNGVPKTPLH